VCVCVCVCVCGYGWGHGDQVDVGTAFSGVPAVTLA